jgi:NAD(P)-dependent dehydrogenase (short-subunit alcohol dehydrogenase family)
VDAAGRPPVRVPAVFPSTEDLSGRVVLVTGAGRGLGRPIANAMAARGAAVVACGRTEADLAGAVAEMQRRGADAAAVRMDVRDPRSVGAAVDAALGRFGRLDAVVNNAGISVRTPPEDVTPEQWDDLIRTNVSGPFFVAQAAARAMKARGGGTIINIASVLGVRGHRVLAAYAISKGAVVHMTRALAAAWADHGIRVNAVAPGYIDSPLNAYRVGTPLEDEVLRATPLHRWGQVEDVATACVFLASPAAAFITGHVLFVDGGLSGV